jgi:flagellar biosynthesis/type III secretory pathway M-ring protein FliF/YscJ
MLKEKAEAILRPIVGFDNVVAMVSCEMDFNNIDRVVENYDSERAVPVQEKTVTENDSRIRPSNGGKSGIASNSPQELDLSQLGNNRPAATARADNVSEKQRKTVEKSFLVPKTVEKTSIKGARVKRLTVAVTVARDAEKGARSPAELKQLEELVTAAVGVENYFTPEQLKKNPIVTVQEMSFVPQAKPVPPAISIVDQVLFEIDKYSHSPLIRPVFGFLLLLVLYKVFRKYFSGTAVEGMEFSGMSDSSVYGEDLRRIESEEQTEKEKNDREMLLESLEQGNKATPETVADILERWLASDQG